MMMAYFDPEGERMHAAHDAEQARLLAIEALGRGRLVLGLRFAQAALDAHRFARSVNEAEREPMRWAAEPDSMGIFPAPPSSRCCADRLLPALRTDPGRTVEICWGALYLERSTGVWRHVNSARDAEHTPVPQEKDQAVAE